MTGFVVCEYSANWIFLNVATVKAFQVHFCTSFVSFFSLLFVLEPHLLIFAHCISYNPIVQYIYYLSAGVSLVSSCLLKVLIAAHWSFLICFVTLPRLFFISLGGKLCPNIVKEIFFLSLNSLFIYFPSPSDLIRQIYHVVLITVPICQTVAPVPEL